jgi:hypothetical protein
MPFSLSRAVNSPLMAQTASIIRTTGVFAMGGWKATNTETVPFYGVIAVATDQVLQMVPEGDRVEGSMMALSELPLFRTSLERSGISDELVWRNENYRVRYVGPWTDYGYWFAILERMKGA